jgi:hypothetical protein
MIQLGYPVNKNIDIPKELIGQLMDNFIRNEEQRQQDSVPHSDIINSLKNRGTN